MSTEPVTPGGYEVPPKPETKISNQIYVRFRDGHTEVYRDPQSISYLGQTIILTWAKSKVYIERSNVLFVEESTIETVVKLKKDIPGNEE